MRKVFKYPLAIRERQLVPWPASGEVLGIAMQHEKLCAWVAVDVDNVEPEQGYVRVYGTGHAIEDYAGLKHLATVLDGQFVWHVFEEK